MFLILSNHNNKFNKTNYDSKIMFISMKMGDKLTSCKLYTTVDETCYFRCANLILSSKNNLLLLHNISSLS